MHRHYSFSFLIVLTIIIIGIPSQLLSQSDSIRISEEILNIKDESLQLETIITHLYNEKNLSPTHRYKYLKKGYNLTIKLKNQEKQYSLMIDIAGCYIAQDKLDSALFYYNKVWNIKNIKDIIPNYRFVDLNHALSGALQDKANKTNSIVESKALLLSALKHSTIAIDANNKNKGLGSLWLLRGNANCLLGDLLQKEAVLASNKEEKNTFLQNALGYYEDAIEAFNNVLLVRPSHPDIKINLCITYRNKGKLLGQKLYQLDNAILSLEKALVYYKGDFETYRLLGVANGIKGYQINSEDSTQNSAFYHKKAIAYFEKALELKFDSAPIYYNLEVAYLQLNNKEKATECREKWKAIDPDYDPTND